MEGVPRGMTLEQAQNERRDRQIDALTQKMDLLFKKIEDGTLFSHRTNGDSFVHGDSGDEGQSRPRPRREQGEDHSIKVELPDFDGSLDPDKYLDWVQRVERIFEYKEYDDRRKFKVAILKLTKYASLWYENLKAKRKREG